MKKFLTHYIVLAVIQFGLIILINFITWLITSVLIASLVSGNLIYWKERYDCVKPNPTGFSKKDIVKGIGGMIAGTFLAILVLMIFGG